MEKYAQGTPGGKWDDAPKLMISNFQLSCHPKFQATSLLGRGRLKSKGGGRLSIHFCADDDTIETLFRTVVSVNLLNIYGALEEQCEESESTMLRSGNFFF